MADNPFTAPTQSGYNSSPPADDGTEVEANRVKWATIKDKLADPNKNFIDDLITNVSSAFDATINIGSDQSNQMAGSLGFAESELTIASGSVAAVRSLHTIDTESDAASDDLDSMTTAGVSDGAIVIIKAVNASRVVTVKHEAGGVGQFHLLRAADIVLDDTEKRLVVQRDGADWYEVVSPLIDATEAEMEAATASNVYVSPENVQYHPLTAVAWARIDTDGTILDSFNITSVTNPGTGRYLVTLAVTMANANYAVIAMPDSIAGGTATTIGINNSVATTTTQFELLSTNEASASDAGAHVVVFGEIA